MPRKNASTATTKPKIRKIAGKPKPTPKGEPVSRVSRVRATGRGGRGR